jgi:hypothetical protein
MQDREKEGCWFMTIGHVFYQEPVRWNLPKLGSFDRPSLKREARKVFRKICPPPIISEPFKVLERLLVL